MDIAPMTDTRSVVLQIARQQVPPVLAAAGLLTLVFAAVNALTIPDETANTWVINAVFGPVFLVLAWVMHRGAFADRALLWIWTGCSVALVAMLVQAYVQLPTAANLAYIAVVMIAFAPLSHEWLPFIVGAAAMFTISVVGFASVDPAVTLRENLLVCASALLVGAVLLRLRLQALTRLAELQLELAREATIDPLTGLLNRHGLERTVPSLLATAQRSGSSILVWFVDVRGLKSANDRLGHAFGDTLLTSVSRALRACIRTNDILVRWGGDEFLVLGTGAPGTATDLNERIDALLAQDGSIGNRWHATVTVGFASTNGPTDKATLDRLIEAADRDMYRRRTAPTGPREP